MVHCTKYSFSISFPLKVWDPEHENLLKKKLDAFGEPIEPEETKGKPKRKGLLKVLGKELNP